MTIHHVALWSKDIEAVSEFYVRFFGAAKGAKYVNATTGFSSYFLRFADGANLEIMHKEPVREKAYEADAQYAGFTHLAISAGSRDNVERKTEELRAAGYRVVSESRWTGDGYYESCVLDPEGNTIEITV